MASPIVITYDNEPNEPTHFYIKTLTNNGWNYRLIGEGEKWEGWVTRMMAYRKELGSLPPDQVVVLTDARDVVCVRSPKAFMDGFNIFKKDIVVSMELTCGGRMDVPDDIQNAQCKPLTKYWAHHNITRLPHRKYVNNGLVCGKARALKTMLDWIIANNYKDDQLGLGNYVNEFPDRVALDVDAELLHTSTAGVNAGVLSIHIQKHDSPSLAELFGRGAFFLHIAGMGGKGQRIMYNCVRVLIDSGTSCKMLSSAYNYPEPKWDEKF